MKDKGHKLLGTRRRRFRVSMSLELPSYVPADYQPWIACRCQFLQSFQAGLRTMQRNGSESVGLKTSGARYKN